MITAASLFAIGVQGKDLIRTNVQSEESPLLQLAAWIAVQSQAVFVTGDNGTVVSFSQSGGN